MITETSGTGIFGDNLSLHLALTSRKLVDGLVLIHPSAEEKQPTYVGKIDTTGYRPGMPGPLVQFHWVATRSETDKRWSRLWSKSEQVARPASGKSGSGLWDAHCSIGLEHGCIAIPPTSGQTVQNTEQRVVVSHFDTDSGLWHGMDGLQPLKQYHTHIGGVSLTLLEPIPTRRDGLPVTLFWLVPILEGCGYNSWFEHAPFLQHLLDAA